MKHLLAAALACGAMAPAIAAAEPGMAGEIYGPTVRRGETEIEMRGAVLNGGDEDGDWQLKAEASHAFTDWWRVGVVGEWENEDGDSEFAAAAIENVVDFTATRDWPVHLGGYFEYEFGEDAPDAIELKLLMEHARGPVELRLNLIGEREVGGGAGGDWEFGYAAQAQYQIGDDFAFGLQGFGDSGADESFGDLDDQAHYWGPFAQFEAAHVGDGEIEIQVGYLAGLGEANADGQFRLKLEYELAGAR